MRVTPFASAATLSLALVAGVARAQSAPSQGTDASARTLFLDGLEAFDRGEAERSLQLLRASYEIRQRPVVMLNIGQVLRALGRTVEAIDAFREYLRVGGSQLPRERVELVQQTIDYLVTQTATVTIGSEPAGATIRIDGRESGRTPTPTDVRLAAGEHAVDIEQPGYVVVREHIVLRPGQHRALTFRLAGLQTAGTLALRVSNSPAPTNLRVAIDGVEVGTAPVERTLAQGGHQISVAAPGFDPFRAEVVLGVRQRRDLAVHLDRSRPLARQPWLWTTVGVLAAGAVAGIALAVTLGHDADQPYIVTPVPSP